MDVKRSVNSNLNDLGVVMEKKSMPESYLKGFPSFLSAEQPFKIYNYHKAKGGS